MIWVWCATSGRFCGAVSVFVQNDKPLARYFSPLRHSCCCLEGRRSRSNSCCVSVVFSERKHNGADRRLQHVGDPQAEDVRVLVFIGTRKWVLRTGTLLHSKLVCVGWVLLRTLRGGKAGAGRGNGSLGIPTVPYSFSKVQVSRCHFATLQWILLHWHALIRKYTVQSPFVMCALLNL